MAPHRVELLAAQASSKLPLLEMWAGNAWRWHLVSPQAQLEQVRQTLKPRSLLTVYPEPPSVLDNYSTASPRPQG